MKLAGLAGAGQVGIAEFVICSRSADEILALLPLDLDRRDRNEQGAGKIAGPADAGLRDRLLGRHLGEALGERRRVHGGFDGTKSTCRRYVFFMPSVEKR